PPGTAEANPGTPLQSPCLRIVRPELRAESCAPREAPRSPSDIHEAQRCAGEIPGRMRSHAACRTSRVSSPEPCRTPGSEMPPAEVADSAWPVADPSFPRKRDSRERSEQFLAAALRSAFPSACGKAARSTGLDL